MPDKQSLLLFHARTQAEWELANPIQMLFWNLFIPAFLAVATFAVAVVFNARVNTSLTHSHAVALAETTIVSITGIVALLAVYTIQRVVFATNRMTDVAEWLDEQSPHYPYGCCLTSWGAALLLLAYAIAYPWTGSALNVDTRTALAAACFSLAVFLILFVIVRDFAHYNRLGEGIARIDRKLQPTLEAAP